MSALVGSDHDWQRIAPRNGSPAMRCACCRTVWLGHELKPRRACTPDPASPPPGGPAPRPTA